MSDRPGSGGSGGDAPAGRIRQLIAEVAEPYPDDTRPDISVSVWSGDGQRMVDIRGERLHRAASLMKLAVMVRIFRLVDAGALHPDQRVEVRNDFASTGAGGVRFRIDPTEDADLLLYRHLGRSLTVRFLVERMITVSSNLATNLLFSLLDPADLDGCLRSLGAERSTVVRPIEDPEGRVAGGNRVCADDMSALLWAILSRTAATPASCEAMLGVLSRQQWNDELPHDLPAGCVVAHKTGWLTGVLHDAAIVFPPAHPPYVVSVLTSGLADAQVARRLIGRLGRVVHEQLTE